MKQSKEEWFSDLEKRIDKVNTIVIYGAGNYGEKILKELLSRIVLKKIVFAVSKIDEQREIFGHEIINIEDCIDKNVLVIISVGANLNAEMKHKLEELEIDNYVELTEDIRDYLKTANYNNPVVGELTRFHTEMLHDIYQKILLSINKIERLEEVYKKIDALENRIIEMQTILGEKKEK